MKSTSYRPLVKAFSAICLTLILAAASAPRTSANEKAKSAAAFERLISLVGEWEGTNSSGQVKATYTLVSGGTALMERLQSGNEPEMLTLYTLDGDHLNVTHYCSSGNQPQMKTAAITELNGSLTFKMFQVTGMKSPDEAHMTGLVVTMPDRDHFTQQWTYLERGKTQSDLFKFTRKS
ncbi:MAG TPA: hypothetical protein VN025_03415 [Candidatus Dormibacteraeota bacterium]|jgi:hypothetical protein|nr:hypothetical protein [Candidatus Dormibacteraeota bacterium]